MIASSNPVGRAPVGEEDASLRTSTIKPVEQLAKGAKTSSAPGDQQAEGYEEPRSGDAEPDKNKLQRKEEQQRLQIAELAARDREVRAHEQAHISVGGQYAGAAKFQFERGPDGVNYAVGGEVSIDISKEVTPEQTLRKAQTVRRAALAPAEPSPQDRRVAAEASRIETEARQEISLQQRREVLAEKDAEPSETEVKSKEPAADEFKEVQNKEPAEKPEFSLPEGVFSMHSRLNAGISNANTFLQSPRQGSILDQIV